MWNISFNNIQIVTRNDCRLNFRHPARAPQKNFASTTYLFSLPGTPLMLSCLAYFSYLFFGAKLRVLPINAIADFKKF